MNIVLLIIRQWIEDISCFHGIICLCLSATNSTGFFFRKSSVCFIWFNTNYTQGWRRCAVRRHPEGTFSAQPDMWHSGLSTGTRCWMLRFTSSSLPFTQVCLATRDNILYTRQQHWTVSGWVKQKYHPLFSVSSPWNFWNVWPKKIKITYVNFFFGHISISKISAKHGLVLDKKEVQTPVTCKCKWIVLTQL